MDYLIGLIIGFIIGFLMGRIDRSVTRIIRDVRELANNGNAQFIEPTSFKEKFNNAKTVDDLLK